MGVHYKPKGCKEKRVMAVPVHGTPRVLAWLSNGLALRRAGPGPLHPGSPSLVLHVDRRASALSLQIPFLTGTTQCLSVKKKKKMLLVGVVRTCATKG